MIPNNTI